jgi:plasmid stabilization system protein ParE
MRSLKTLKVGVDRAIREVERAEKEIDKLRRELKAGTLDRKKLESGLEKLNCYLAEIPSHVPPFGSGT